MKMKGKGKSKNDCRHKISFMSFIAAITDKAELLFFATTNPQYGENAHSYSLSKYSMTRTQLDGAGRGRKAAVPLLQQRGVHVLYQGRTSKLRVAEAGKEIKQQGKGASGQGKKSLTFRSEA